MNNLFLMEETRAIAAAKWAALALPITLTFLKIGIAEWKLRRAREEAERRMASSLARALANLGIDVRPAAAPPDYLPAHGTGAQAIARSC